MIFLFGFGKREDGFVISKSLYDKKKEENEIYELERSLSPHEELNLYTAFSTPEPFITDKPLSDKDLDKAKKLEPKLTISRDQAKDLILAKSLGCPMVLSNKEVWLQKSAKKIGVRTKILK
jgi:hypothetical protein